MSPPAPIVTAPPLPYTPIAPVPGVPAVLAVPLAVTIPVRVDGPSINIPVVFFPSADIFTFKILFPLE